MSSMRLVEADDACSAVSDAVSQAYSCPPAPLRRRTRLKKTAPAPPSKVTTPLSSASHSNGGLSTDSMPAIGLGHLGDDCAINELLEGRMELEVVLPDSRHVRMTVERRTPMMDLLVQVTTANKINPGGHVIHILTDRGKDFIHYKPNTPIGSLDTNTVYIVPKSAIIDPPVKKMPKVANKPFEQTFRLQVNLPRGQLMVLRISPRTTLADVKQMACSEKNLDYSRYQLVDTRFPNQILDLNSRMEDYGSTEITLMSNSSINANIRNSNADLIAYSTRDEDKKKKGILGLFSRKKSKGSTADSSSDSMDSRGVSPSRGEENRRISAKSGSKKRPAPPPPPPAPVKPVASEKSPLRPPVIEPVDGTTVSHSRHSSDSSGYHEASVLSDSPENPPSDMGGRSGHDRNPTRKTSTPTKPTQQKPVLSKASSYSENALWSTASKKRKAPPPPPQSSNGSTLPVTTLEPSVSSNASSSLSIDAKSIVEEPVEVEVHAPPYEPSSPAPSSSPPLSIDEEPYIASSPPPTDPLPSTSRPSSPVLDSGIVLEDSDSLTDELSVHPETAKEQTDFFPLNKGGPTQTSHTSLNTIDDIENDFEQMIAEAQRSLDESEEPPPMNKQEMLSHIEATFSAVENSKDVPAVVAEQDDLGWEYTIPDPPPAFRNDEARIVSEEARNRSSSDSSCASFKTPPPLPGSQPPPLENHVSESSSSSDSEQEDQVSTVVSREFVAPKPRRPLLQNFTFGTYKAPKEDILAVLSNESPKTAPTSYSQIQVAWEDGNSTVPRKSLLQERSMSIPVDDRLVGGLDGSLRGFKGQVKQRCAEMKESGTSAALVTRCMSMMDVNRKIEIEDLPRKNIQRSTSGLDQSRRKAQSTQNLSRHRESDSDEDAQLEEQCSKLHQKFLDWNQKLKENQDLLVKQKIVVNTEASKAQTLPRPPKTKFVEVQESRKPISTLERPKSQVLANVTIGSWQQRKSTENLAGIPPATSAIARLRPEPVASKPRPVSIHAVPYRNAITAQVIASQALAKPKIDIHFSNFEAKPSALRTSIQKTEFRAPEVRTINSRQRLPSVAKDEPVVTIPVQEIKEVKVVAKVNGFNPSAEETLPKGGETFFKEPPPLPQVPIASQPVLKSGGKRLFRTLPPKLEPREELMLEIRNFGGRHALRKIPTNQGSWQIKVYGNSSVNA